MKQLIFKIQKFTLLFIVLFMCSCEDPYVTIKYTLTCDEALLNYATPQVTYKGNDGDTIKFQLSDNEWKKESNYSKWEKEITYNDFSHIEDEITITYIPKENIPSDAKIFIDFTHDLSASLEIRDEDGHVTNNSEIRTMTTTINIGNNMPLKEAILKYKNYLGFKVNNDGTWESK